jgi:hypothetical protein
MFGSCAWRLAALSRFLTAMAAKSKEPLISLEKIQLSP